MKNINIKHIIYVIIFVFGLTNCTVFSEEFSEDLKGDIMVIIDGNGGFLDIIKSYFIIECGEDEYIRLPNHKNLLGYELNIDGKMYLPESQLYVKNYSSESYKDVCKLSEGGESIYFDIPSDRTIIFKAIWKE